ncbi:MAG TPA: AraC family transcriptional regulator [Kofleriaceae bacterium]|nr:AraC family transcriptional regulator [Kofleriaceae bacterium]
MTDRPDPQAGARADVLSSLLALVRLRGDLVYRAELAAPWALAFPPGPSHLYFVERGELWIAIGGAPPLQVAAGDLVLLPHGTGHVVADRRALRTTKLDPFAPPRFDPARLRLANAGSGAATHFVGGRFEYETGPLPPVIAALPAVLRIAGDGGRVPQWLEQMSQFLLVEASQPAPGSSLMISRMIDLLVIRALRSWAAAHPDRAGWIGGAREERIGSVLTAMHADPARPWTLDVLARVAGMSRTTFVERFTAAVGQAPLQYLARWRMTLAADLLRGGSRTVAEVARQVGYRSEPGFSRAFRNLLGHAPRQDKPRAGTS